MYRLHLRGNLNQVNLISTGILILTELILRKEPHREHAEKNKLFLYKSMISGSKLKGTQKPDVTSRIINLISKGQHLNVTFG